MDTSRSSDSKDSEQHRETVAPTSGSLNRTASIMSNPAPPRRHTVDRSKQRCFYAVFVILLVCLLLGCLVSFIFFIIIDVEIEEDGSSGFWQTCILFAKGNSDLRGGAWSCDTVLGIKTLVILVTLGMTIIHLISLCRGHSVLSACRCLDMMVFVILALMSGTAGIILRVGLEHTCSNSNRCHDDKPLEFMTFITASQYVTFGVAGVFLCLFFVSLVMLLIFCTCSRQARPPTEERTRLLTQGPRIYSTIRDNPFRDTSI